MSKIKSAEQWIKTFKAANPNGIKTEQHLINCINTMLKQCRQATLEVAADDGKVRSLTYLDIPYQQHYKIRGIAISKQSILSLSDSPSLKID